MGNLEDDVFKLWFGPARTAEFIAQGWFTRKTKEISTSEEEVYYDWGPRAELVVNKQVLIYIHIFLNKIIL